MRHLIAVIAIIFCTLGYGAYRNNDVPDLCSQWAEQIVAGKDNYTMHALGCDDKTGTYRRAEGRCMEIAYMIALHNTDTDFLRQVGQHGCVLFEDGSWGDE